MGPIFTFDVLGFLRPNRKIINAELFRMKISIDLDSLRTYPTSRNLLKICLKNQVPTILFIAPLTEVVPICTINLNIGR